MKNNLMQKVKTSGDMVREILKLGYTEKPKNGGSHRIFICPGKSVISLPDHNNGRSILSEGAKRNIIKLALGNSYYQK